MRGGAPRNPSLRRRISQERERPAKAPHGVQYNATCDGAFIGNAYVQTCHRERNTMLYTIAVILIVLWLLGLVSSYTIGGFIHVLLVIAIVMVLLRIISGRRPL